MKSSEIFAQVAEIVCLELGLDDGVLITKDSRIVEDLDGDSVDRVAIFLICEDTFGIKIPDNQATRDLKTVGQISDLVVTTMIVVKLVASVPQWVGLDTGQIVTAESHLVKDLNIDSLGLISLCAGIEDTFGVQLAPSAPGQFRQMTIGGVADLVKTLLTQPR